MMALPSTEVGLEAGRAAWASEIEVINYVGRQVWAGDRE
jgi:hypothetical protein